MLDTDYGSYEGPSCYPRALFRSQVIVPAAGHQIVVLNYDYLKVLHSLPAEAKFSTATNLQVRHLPFKSHSYRCVDSQFSSQFFPCLNK